MGEFASKEDVLRVEGALVRLAESVEKLVLIDERQVVQNGRIDKLEAVVETLKENQVKSDAKVAAWVNRGIGLWGAVVIAWSVFTFFKGH